MAHRSCALKPIAALCPLKENVSVVASLSPLLCHFQSLTFQGFSLQMEAPETYSPFGPTIHEHP
jgi:hypothetical protein